MEKTVEEEIQEKGLTAPRITPQRIEEVIVKREFHIFGGRLTVCCLTLNNGFLLIGESSCVNVENFNQEIGERIAFDNAKEKIWVLEGYLLKQRLFEQSNIISNGIQEG